MNTLENCELMSCREVAAFLHVTPVTLCRWRKTKRFYLPYIRLSNKVFYKRSDIEDFLSRRQEGAIQNVGGVK